MSGYAASPAGYLNPVAVDKIQHPDYDAKAAENTTMRLVQYLYPVLKNCSEMLEDYVRKLMCKFLQILRITWSF